MWTRSLNPLVTPYPILQTLNVLSGLFMLAWEYPFPLLIPGSAMHSCQQMMTVLLGVYRLVTAGIALGEKASEQAYSHFQSKLAMRIEVQEIPTTGPELELALTFEFCDVKGALAESGFVPLLCSMLGTGLYFGLSMSLEDLQCLACWICIRSNYEPIQSCPHETWRSCEKQRNGSYLRSGPVRE